MKILISISTLGTIHLSRRQILQVFDPSSPSRRQSFTTIRRKFDQFLTPPLKNADVLNGCPL